MATFLSHQSLSKDALEPHKKYLPECHTKGITKPTYEPRLSSKAKYPMSTHMSFITVNQNQTLLNQLSVVSIPNYVQEVIGDPKLKTTMNEEMTSLQKKNKTWKLVDLPLKKKSVGCRWIYNVKYKADVTIEYHKVRLVAKGYSQTYRIDYTETFAPIAKINTIRMLLSLAANLDCPLQQFDMKNVFQRSLQGSPIRVHDTRETQSKGMKIKKKSLYRLIQSPKAWFGRFTKYMISFGYHESNLGNTLLLKRQYAKITALIIYVDGMVITGNDYDETKALHNYLSKEFEMKDLDLLKYFLGKFLSQRKYAVDLLQETGMLAHQSIDTLIKEGLMQCMEF